jgi:CRP/FNR family transcriptional regulator
MLCHGHVKLSTYSEEGRAVILRIAEPGEVLGLSSCISEKAYEVSAQAMDLCIIRFVRNVDFRNLIQTHHEAALNAIRQLSSNYQRAHDQICSLGLSVSAGDKLLRLLLQWCDRSGNSYPVRISPVLTHGEIAEMIGTSRETVTRLFKSFKERDLIKLSKVELCIPDRARLRSAIGSKHGNGNGF